MNRRTAEADDEEFQKLFPKMPSINSSCCWQFSGSKHLAFVHISRTLLLLASPFLMIKVCH